MIEIHDGWMFGTLPDHHGNAVPVERFNRGGSGDKPSPGPLKMNPPNPCLHCTDGGNVLGDRYKFWDFPPNFACGDFKIVQLYRLGLASHAVDTKDEFLLQIELPFRLSSPGGIPATQIYLPPASTLNPLVALAAWLHQTERVTSFLRRPNPDWPVSLDRLPAATDDYYRRNDGTWPAPGVYGHVELPDDEHYDPASFDYPRFFDLVREAIEQEDDMGVQEDIIAGSAAGREAPLGSDPPEGKSAIWRWAFNESQRIKRAATLPAPGEPADHEHNIIGKAR